MTSYFPYSQLIETLLKATVVNHSYTSGWTVSVEPVAVAAEPEVTDEPLTELYY